MNDHEIERNEDVFQNVYLEEEALAGRRLSASAASSGLFGG
jgi:hypothetical protein